MIRDVPRLLPKRPVPRLLVITDPGMPGGIVAPVEAALRGLRDARGTASEVAIALRAKSIPGIALVEAGHALRALCDAAGATFLVNGRVDVAVACRADGVHLPEGGMHAGDVRTVLGAESLVGRSCHDARGLERARDEGADYATLGPIGVVEGKNVPLGLEGFAALAHQTPVPVLALGGVEAADVPPLRAKGAYGVAVIRGVLGSAVPASALRDFLSSFTARR